MSIAAAGINRQSTPRTCQAIYPFLMSSSGFVARNAATARMKPDLDYLPAERQAIRRGSFYRLQENGYTTPPRIISWFCFRFLALSREAGAFWRHWRRATPIAGRPGFLSFRREARSARRRWPHLRGWSTRTLRRCKLARKPRGRPGREGAEMHDQRAGAGAVTFYPRAKAASLQRFDPLSGAHERFDSLVA
jgi:hypothetical protein